ncbi:uncharacterized protein K02A2.6 [Trichonephila clavata]|uniref:Uncharacterized protein K02A2.6 n=1 Tax=Trichonephila clavata TaxID=2740835 RepID=A0A8X6F5J4_TRICU|nr:uncharacterized protein K02A2.6 [Trichonephila clavata]
MPWERIHVDFAGPIFEHMLFIVVAHSKWLEVYPMKVTTTKTIECLRDSFARFGLPRHTETQRSEEELGSYSVPEVPSADVAVSDVSQSSAKVTNSEKRSLPVPERLYIFPRRSGRIRRPPERLVL